MKNLDVDNYLIQYVHSLSDIKGRMKDENGKISENNKKIINQQVKREILQKLLSKAIDIFSETINLEKDSVRVEFYIIPKDIFNYLIKKKAREKQEKR